jgi:hypothetical protein
VFFWGEPPQTPPCRPLGGHLLLRAFGALRVARTRVYQWLREVVGLFGLAEFGYGYG